MTARPMNLLLMSLLLAGATTVAHAGDLYQWKDAKGVTHYADAPPPKGQHAARHVQIRDGDAPAAVAAGVTATPATNATATTNCAVAKGNLQLLQAGGNIGLDANHDGKPDAPLSADELAQQRQLAEKTITRYCVQATTAQTP